MTTDSGVTGEGAQATCTIHGLFEAQVDRAPDRIACSMNGQSLTYLELERRANRLAHHLRGLGVGPEARVAIHLERSPETVIAILGVLKAGGAYVPLDPEHPAERHRFMIEDSGARVLISRRSMWTGQAPLREAAFVCLDESPAAGPEERPAAVNGPGDLAYVLYTSGSTGVPKGVMVTHYNVVRLFSSTEAWFGFGHEDVWSLFHSFAFDFSVWELWGALAYGGRVVIVPFPVSRSPETMARLLVEEGVTMLSQTPSAFRRLAPAILGARTAPPLRCVVFGGEALDFSLLRPWFERFGDERPRMVNMYGITETTVHVTYRPIRAGDAASEGPSRIGIPIPDLELAVVDERLEPVAVGEVGEIIVGGAGVARGYLNRLELEAQRFVERAGRRFYRSGDLARVLPDGEVQYLGRADAQVKVRGFRIETGEIEAHLIEAGLAGAVVRAVGEAGQARLVAWCVPRPGERLDRPALRRHLGRTLPDFMVPAAFVALEQLPLTANGKLDERALPVPGADAAAYRPPENDTEALLARLWAEALGGGLDIGDIGRDDNFVALGGQSLDASRVLRQILAERSVALTFRDFLAASTLAELARAVDALRPPESSTVLSFSEEQLILLARLAPGLPLYSEGLVVRVAAALDISRLERAFAALAGRHAVLRARYGDDEGIPRRVVDPVARVAFAHHDLSALPAEELERRAMARQREGFDLATGPLWRVDVYSLGGEEHCIHLSFHHAVLDGAACATLVTELAALYSGAALPVAPLGIEDVAIWQRGRLPDIAARHLPYWRERLAGLEPADLPVDHPRPLVRSFRGMRLRCRLADELVGRLRALARDSGVTLFTSLLAAFAALIARHGRQDEVAVGTISAGRSRPESQDVLGSLVNPVVLRQAVPPDPPFRAFLADVSGTLLAAHAHAELPFATLVSELGAGGDPSRNPLFQVAFSANVPIPDPLPGWSVEIGPFDNGTARFDLAVQVDESRGGVDLFFEASRDLFEPVTVERMAGRYTTLLDAVAAGGELPLAELPLLDARERAALEAFGGGSVPEVGPLFLERFQRQVLARPEATAAVCGDAHLTYSELDRRSDDVAGRLTALGVGLETLVGLGAPPSLDWLVGMLGILKAGAAFLPLDPGFPRGRLAGMLADARVPVLCTVGDAFAGFGGRVLDLAACTGDAERRFSPLVHRRSLAYVIYTSGSTGQPKGVLIEHGSLANMIEAHLRLTRLGAADRVSQLASPSFDASLLEALPALSAGATLVIAPPEARLPGAEMAELLRRERVTVLFLLPAPLAALPPAELPDLRLIATGGEALGAELVDRWAPGGALLNFYGPTEATVFATAAWCAAGGGKPPIGCPTHGARVYVVDERMRRCPIGVPGELLVGGPGVGRGYLRREGLTAERFLPDPFAGDGGTVYRTGDLVRFRPDGQLEFLSRLDRQVKLRGVRIEPGEIEAALCRHASVAQAVAMVREDRPGDRRLVAYVVWRGLPAAPDELRRFLAESLPETMIPTAFVTLPAIPLSPSGKLDSKAFPLPAAPERRVSRASSGIEAAVAGVWREVLGVDEVGVEEPFFEAGGTSLSLARVQALFLNRLGAEVDMTTLLRLPTVAALAGHLRGLAPAEPAAPVPVAGGERVAVIGMALRGPGVERVDDLWPLLLEGRDAITWFLPDQERPAGFVPAEGVLADALAFDAGFFGITAADAALMDPQHRVFLEAAWSALEDAGYDPRRAPGRIGVFGGAGMPRYWLGPVAAALAGDPSATVDRMLGQRAEICNGAEFLTSRTASKLGLTGPAVTVQTACSTSAAAIHLARQALLAGECEMAIAGGVSLASVTSEGRGYLAADGGILSATGRCRPFSAAADGTVGASGVALVVLKRLDDARRDGDSIRAVLLASALNNDGGTAIGFSAPSEEGQCRVLQAAYAEAGVEPASVAFVEAHGTGTAQGDAIEVAALRRVFGPRAEGCPVSLTSLKAVLGHLDAAAGAAGLIKAALCLQRRCVPGLPDFAGENPRLRLSESPFVVHGDARPLPASDAPLRAGVSSFGIGGTNVHLVLEEAPPAESGPPARTAELLCLSARTAEALESLTDSLAEHLREAPDPIADAAFTLASGRAELSHRRAVVVGPGEDVASALADRARRQSGVISRSPSVAFLFPGQGAQVVNMGRALYRQHSVFRREVDHALEILRGDGLDLAPFLLDGDALVDDGAVAQPAIFVTSWAAARLLLSWGVQPTALFGHSLGEYAAATVAGVFPLPEALRLVRDRGRLMAAAGRGAMTSVLAGRADVERHVGSGVAIATDAPGATVLSGPVPAIAAAEAELARFGFESKRLAVTQACHSPQMAPIRDAFAKRVARVPLAPPSLPILSCVTGGWLTGEQATDPAYWADQLCGTVNLTRGLGTLLADAPEIVVDIGPGRSMHGFLRRHPAATDGLVAVSLLPKPGGDREGELLLDALGRLWVHGVPIDWEAFYAGERRRRIPLPTYPFERTVHTVGRPEATAAPAPEALGHGLREALDSLGAALVHRYFVQAAGVRPGSTHAVADLRARLRLLPRFERMFDHLLALLCRHGIVERAGSSVTWRKDPCAGALRDDLLAGHPGISGLVRFLEHCIDAYPGALSGEVEPIGVLYPDGTDAFYRQCMAETEPFSAESLCLDAGRQAAVEAVRGLGRPARLLEVGAGHGTLTWPLVEELAKEEVEYVFTDIGRSFLVAAGEEAARRGLPWLRTGRLDLNLAPAAQGYAPGSFDLVLGFNAVHTAADTARTLGWLDDLLAPGGLLVLVEATRIEPWEHLIWGLAPGFWDVRPHSAAAWRALLEAAGFVGVASVPGGDHHDHAVLLAQRDPAAASPAPSLEAEVAGLWQRLLGVEHVHPEDGFFDLGGDSLLAVQLLAELRVRLGVEVKVSQFSQAPTAEGLMALVAGQIGAAAPAVSEEERPEPIAKSSDETELLALAQRFLELTAEGPAGDEVVHAFFARDDRTLLYDSYDSDVRGFEAIRFLYADEHQAIRDPRFRLYDPFVRVAPGGQAAWVAALVDSTMTLRRSGRPLTFRRTRVTFAFEKHMDAAWRVVHVHYSIPVGVPLRMME